MPQNITQFTATGTFSDTSTVDITNTAAWTVSDSSIVTVGSANGQVTIQAAGKIWGADVGLTATLAPGTAGTASLVVIASDSGSVAPRMPQQDNHWVALGLSPWGAYGGCQEPTGTLALSGSAGYTLTPNAPGGLGIAWQQAVAGGGWLRNAISTSGTVNARIVAGAGVGPNVNTTSTAWLGYCKVDPSGIGTNILGLLAAAGANRLLLSADNTSASTGQIDLNAGGTIKPLVGPLTRNHGDRVHPLLLIYNKTTGEAWACTDQCITMSGGLPALTDGTKGFGGNNVAGVSASIVFFASATGSVIEALCSVSASGDFLSRLGWSVPWKACPRDSGTIRLPFTPSHWRDINQSPWAASVNFSEELGNFKSFDVWAGTLLAGWQLTVAGAVSYRTVQAGWDRRSADVTETAARATTANNVIGSYTGSAAFLGYAKMSTAAGANRVLLGGYNALLGGQMYCQYGVAGIPQVVCSGTTITGINDHRDGRFHPFLLVYDVTNSRAKLYTDIEAVTGTFGVLNQTPSIGVGALNAANTAGAASFNFFTACTGSTAEALSDDGRASRFLKDLGWSPLF